MRLRRRQVRFLVFRTVLGVILFLTLDRIAGILWPSPIAIGGNDPKVDILPTMGTVLDDSRGLSHLRFRFEPHELWRIVYIVFGLDRPALEATFQALAISSIPEVPSTLQWFEDGHVKRQTVLSGLGAHPAGSEYSFRFSPGEMEVYQDEVPAARVAFLPDGGPLRMGFSPNKPVGNQRRAYGVLSRLEFETLNGEDTIITRPWRPWHRHWVRGVLLILVAVFVLRMKYRFPRVNNTVYTLAGVFLVLTMGFMIHRALFFHMRDWTRPYYTDGVFDAQKFMAADFIQIKDRKLRIDPDPDLINVLVFGGSTTIGDPYQPQDRMDYPSQLEDMLNRSEAFRGRRFQVVNLGNLGNTLQESLRLMEALFQATLPRVVVLSSVVNNYYEPRPHVMLAHVLGNARPRVPLRPEFTQQYAERLQQVAALCRKYNAQPLWIEEFLDVYFFEGDNILAAHHKVLREVAARERVPILLFQEEVDANPNRLLFNEYVHLTSIGYRFIADRLLAWFESHATIIARPSPHPGDPS